VKKCYDHGRRWWLKRFTFRNIVFWCRPFHSWGGGTDVVLTIAVQRSTHPTIQWLSPKVLESPRCVPFVLIKYFLKLSKKRVVNWIGWIKVGRRRANQPATSAIGTICDLGTGTSLLFSSPPPQSFKLNFSHIPVGGLDFLCERAISLLHALIPSMGEDRLNFQIDIASVFGSPHRRETHR
jgi:hypothetical protein